MILVPKETAHLVKAIKAREVKSPTDTEWPHQTARLMQLEKQGLNAAFMLLSVNGEWTEDRPWRDNSGLSECSSLKRALLKHNPSIGAVRISGWHHQLRERHPEFSFETSKAIIIRASKLWCNGKKKGAWRQAINEYLAASPTVDIQTDLPAELFSEESAVHTAVHTAIHTTTEKGEQQ